MRTFPKEKYDFKDLEKLGLNIKDWKVQVLKMNPSYVFWGNNEDYMVNRDGWEKGAILNSIDELWELDEYNELVNFYFLLHRESVNCNDCDGQGLNKETKKIADDWYDFDRKGTRWCDNINDNEVKALWMAGRLKCDFKTMPTVKEVNDWSKSHKGIGHDAINRHICVKARAESLGVYGHCEKCHGEGYIYTEEKVHLQLQMWFLHPRKSASRGVILTNIEKDDLPKIIEYLKEAKKRNNKRFSKLGVIK